MSEEELNVLCKKTRKVRTAFSDQQLSALERSFDRQKYLSIHERKELATRLHLSDTQVKTWYQNRRFDMHLTMVGLCNRGDHYSFALWFLSFFFLSSPNLSGRRLDVYHTSTHGVALMRI